MLCYCNCKLPIIFKLLLPVVDVPMPQNKYRVHINNSIIMCYTVYDVHMSHSKNHGIQPMYIQMDDGNKRFYYYYYYYYFTSHLLSTEL